MPSSELYGRVLGPLLRCRACGHAALAEPGDEDLMASEYALASDDASMREEEGQLATARRDLTVLERVVSPGRLLDVGAWTGSMLVAAGERGWVAEGIEPSAWACDRARQRGCDVRRALLREVDLAPERYRAVVATDVIEHLIEPASALVSINRALEPGAVLFLTLPDAGSVVARLLGPRWWSVLPMHVQYFTRTSMRALLERHGFRVDSISTHPKAFSWGYYADRVRAFVPLAGRIAPAAVRAAGWSERIVAPDLRDRMAVVARKIGPGAAVDTAS